MMDDECVPESQCGCNTEEGATIPLGSTFENCDEVCTCGDDKMYSCVARDSGDVPDGCESTADAAANAIEGLEAIRDEFVSKASELQTGMKANTADRFAKIVQRVIRFKNKFLCESNKRKRRNVEKSALEGNCPALVELTKDATSWIDDNITDCGKQNRSDAFKNQIQKIETKLVKRCDQKRI